MFETWLPLPLTNSTTDIAFVCWQRARRLHNAANRASSDAVRHDSFQYVDYNTVFSGGAGKTKLRWTNRRYRRDATECLADRRGKGSSLVTAYIPTLASTVQLPCTLWWVLTTAVSFYLESTRLNTVRWSCQKEVGYPLHPFPPLPVSPGRWSGGRIPPPPILPSTRPLTESTIVGRITINYCSEWLHSYWIQRMHGKENNWV